MGINDIKKIKANVPVSVILYGGQGLGFFLAQTLVSQGGKVIIIDNYSTKTKPFIDKLKKLGDVTFFDFKGLEEFYSRIGRIDYLVYLLNEYSEEKDVFDSKEFFNQSKYLDKTLETVKSFKTKFSLVTSLRLNKELSKQVQSVNASAPSPYSNIELQKYCETAVAEYTDKNNINARIIRLGTVIGRNIPRVSDPDVDKLLEDATQRSSISIEGEGLEIHNLIHESDATYGILKMTFMDKTKGEVVTLANKNDYTTLSLAYKSLELNVDAQNIKFVESDRLKPILQNIYIPAPNASKYGWKQQITLEQGLMEQIQSYYEKENKSWNISDQSKYKQIEKETVSKTEKTKAGQVLSKVKTFFERIIGKKNSKQVITPAMVIKRIFILSAIILFSFFILSPILSIGISAGIIYSNSKDLYSSAQSFDFSDTAEKADRIKNGLGKISDNLERLHWIFKIFNGDKFYNSSTQLLLGSQYAVEGAGDLIDSLNPLIEYFNEFEPALDFQSSTGSTTREYRTYLQELEDNNYKIQDSSYKIELAFDIIDKVDISTFPQFMQDEILTFKNSADDLYSVLKPLGDISSFLPDLLGGSERKRYLILLENEGELRSTGGWISSYAILGIEGGQIRELYVDDVYNADGSLKQTYTVPSSMKNALDVDNLTLSLSNWDPDLTNTMYTAEDMISDLGLGNDIDGLITIDISFIQKLLDKWGGLEVDGETELITSDNIYSKIFEMHSEFTPGSSVKATFLANLANATIEKILSSNISGYKGIAEVIAESFEEKHLQATFKNSDAFTYMNSNDWAGSLETKTSGAPIVIDWNWGANKANLYITRNHNLNINVEDENQITFTYSLSIENNSEKDEYPEGEYVNYMRIYLPMSAKILSLQGFKDNDYDIYEEDGYKVVGGWFNVPIQEVSNFEISYKISRDNYSDTFPLTIDGNNKELNLSIFKQAGTFEDAYKVTVTYPTSWNVLQAESFTGVASELNGRFELSKDIPIDITWGE